jgi:hypothetical protein
MKDHQTSKDPTAAVVDLAKRHPGFRSELMREIVKGAAVRDIAIDQRSQLQMLMNMRAGDKVRVVYEPGDAAAPREHVDRIVQSDYDEVLKGVSLRTPGGAEGVLVDKGEPQGVMFWDGPGGQGFQVVELRLNRWWPRTAAEDGDKATASQVQFALDLAKEKGKNYSKGDLAKKTKAQISALIESMQGDANVASEKQVAYALSLLGEAGRKSPSKGSLEKMPEADVSKLIDELKAAAK